MVVAVQGNKHPILFKNTLYQIQESLEGRFEKPRDAILRDVDTMARGPEQTYALAEELSHACRLNSSKTNSTQVSHTPKTRVKRGNTERIRRRYGTYLIVKEPMTFEGAHRMCAEEGMTLAQPTSLTAYKDLVDVAQHARVESFFINTRYSWERERHELPWTMTVGNPITMAQEAKYQGGPQARGLTHRSRFFIKIEENGPVPRFYTPQSMILTRRNRPSHVICDTPASVQGYT